MPDAGATGAGGATGATGGSGAGMSAFAGLSLISTVYGAFSAYQSGKAQKRIAQYNASVAEYQAKDAIDRGEVAVTRRRSQTTQVIGSQRAALASQGVDVNDGSAREVQADARYLGELDAMTIRNNARREAWGFQVEARNATYGGQIAQMNANNRAAETLLTGASSLLLARYGYGRSGVSTDPNILVRP